MRKFIFLLFALLASTHTMKAQEIALKTNLVYDALLTVNLGAEVQLAPRWSLDLSVNQLCSRFKMHEATVFALGKDARCHVVL